MTIVHESLKALIINSANRFIDRTAVVDSEGNVFTYHGLFSTWQIIEEAIIKHTPSSHSNIGILCSSKWHSLQAIGGIVLAEHVYVPLDINSPTRRLKLMIEDCNLNILIVSHDQIEKLSKELSVENTFSVGDLTIMILDDKISEYNILPTELAMILYTSGSSGQPKGVMITHQNILSFIGWAYEEFRTDDSDIFISIAGFHFDLSVLDIYLSIYSGGTLILTDETDLKVPISLSAIIERYQVTVIYATPTLYRALIDFGKLERYKHDSLKYVLYAGESFPLREMKKLKEAWQSTVIYNLYGPTETNVCTYYKIPHDIDEISGSTIPIGQTCGHMTCAILENKKEGELIVSGASVSPGYWNDIEQTKHKQVKQNDITWYRTGDIVSLSDEGLFIFKGRMDRMVKRRGFRIELDEIERCCQSISGVQHVAIVAKINEQEVTKIFCYFVKESNVDNIESEMLRSNIVDLLPLYMMPDSFIELSQLPMTATMKINYQNLKQL